MTAIYQPKGAAREYSPLALNYIKGCDHGCKYCYVPKMMKRFNKNYVHSDVFIKERETLIKEIKKSAKKHRNSDQQVFLSFTTDPYSHFNNEIQLTREVLEILLEHNIPLSLLTKGGKNILQDLDLFKKFGKNIQIGASLTFTQKKDSLKWEPNSSDPVDRMETLKIIHDAGIKTWASMEPVIYPEQSLELMKLTHRYVDSYQVGKLNHFKKYEDKFNWTDFLNKTIEVMRKNDKLFYIKKDLLSFKDDSLELNDYETDMDYLALTNAYNQTSLF